MVAGEGFYRSLSVRSQITVNIYVIYRPRPVNNIFIFSNICKFTGQSLKVAGTRQ